MDLVGYDIDARMVWLAKLGLDIRGATNARLHLLTPPGSLRKKGSLPDPKESFDLILTNPPFGSDFSDEKEMPFFETAEGRSSMRRGVAFLEICLDMLAMNGYLGIVIDDSVLSGQSNELVRDILLRRGTVMGVVSLPSETFMPYASVKASLLLFQKSPPASNGKIFLAAAKSVGRKPNGDSLFKRELGPGGTPVLDNDLPAIHDAWKAFLNHVDVSQDQAVLVSLAQVHAAPGRRLDYRYHEALSSAPGDAVLWNYKNVRLGALVEERREMVVPAEEAPEDAWNFVGLAQIQPTGLGFEANLVPGASIQSAAKIIRRSDIIFAMMRPELRKVSLVDVVPPRTVTSSECLVLQPRKSATPR